MGGTQDNGTFEYDRLDDDNWPQIIYGDGGQSGWNAANSRLRFNSFFGQFHDANFQNGDPTKWVITTGTIAASPEGSNFYPPIIADPNPADGGHDLRGLPERLAHAGLGRQPGASSRPTAPSSRPRAANPACGDFVRIGTRGATDLTVGRYGDRAGGVVAAIERAPSNTGTLWAATNTGRVFITDNATPPAASVTWTRLDTSATNDPSRFVSSHLRRSERTRTTRGSRTRGTTSTRRRSRVTCSR